MRRTSPHCAPWQRTSGVRVVQVAARRAQVCAREAVLDTPGLLLQACGLPVLAAKANVKNDTSQCRWALLRPDSYLAAHGHQLAPTWCMLWPGALAPTYQETAYEPRRIRQPIHRC